MAKKNTENTEKENLENQTAVLEEDKKTSESFSAVEKNPPEPEVETKPKKKDKEKKKEAAKKKK